MILADAIIQATDPDDSGGYVAALVIRGRVCGRFDEYGTFYIPGNPVPAFEHTAQHVRELAEEAEQMFEALEELR